MSEQPKFLGFQRRRQNIFGPLSPTRAWRRRRRGATARSGTGAAPGSSSPPSPSSSPSPAELAPASGPPPSPSPSSRPAELLRRLAPTAAPCPDGSHHLRRLSSKRRFALPIAEDPKWVAGFGPPLEECFGTQKHYAERIFAFRSFVGDSLTLN